MKRQPSIGIIGAGAVGLSSAFVIKEGIPDAQLTVYAKSFEQETTSWGAAGVFRVELSSFPNNSEADVRRWCNQSMTYYWKLQNSDEGPKAGCYLFPMYQVFEEDSPQDIYYKDFVKAYRVVDKNELKSIGVPNNFHSGIFCHSVIVEPRYYLPYLTNLLKTGLNPCVFKKKNISNYEDLHVLFSQHDILINCTGLGARELWNDQQVYAVRGQLIRAKAPWLKFGLYAPNTIHYYPTLDGVVFGGLRQVNDYETKSREEDSATILAKISPFVHGIKNVQIQEVWAGLRPHRHSLRLEVEKLKIASREISVIHNYGHGGHGISLAHGTAVDVYHLVMKELNSLYPPAKL